MKLVAYPVSNSIQRLKNRWTFYCKNITIRAIKDTRCYIKLIESGISIHHSDFSDINDTIRSKELVVPASKLCLDFVEVSEEFSISDASEVQQGVNVENLLLNSTED